jgi:hypothetical protein
MPAAGWSHFSMDNAIWASAYASQGKAIACHPG